MMSQQTVQTPVLSFLMTKGGTSKSSLCREQAVAMTLLKGKKVAVVESDTQGTVSRWHQRRAQYQSEFDVTMVPIECVHAPTQPAAMIDQCQRDHDLVIVDTPGSKAGQLESYIDEVITSSDVIVMPTGSSTDDTDVLSGDIDLILQKNQQDEKSRRILIIKTRVNTQSNIYREFKEALISMSAAHPQIRVCETAMSYLVGYPEAVNQGQSVLEMPGHLKAKAEMTALCNELHAALFEMGESNNGR